MKGRMAKFTAAGVVTALVLLLFGRARKTCLQRESNWGNVQVTRAVVFDLDGTLVNLPIDYEKLFQEVRERAKISDAHPITKTISKLDAKTKGEIFKIWDKLEATAWQQGTV